MVSVSDPDGSGRIRIKHVALIRIYRCGSGLFVWANKNKIKKYYYRYRYPSVKRIRTVWIIIRIRILDPEILHTDPDPNPRKKFLF